MAEFVLPCLADCASSPGAHPTPRLCWKHSGFPGGLSPVSLRAAGTGHVAAVTRRIINSPRLVANVCFDASLSAEAKLGNGLELIFTAFE